VGELLLKKALRIRDRIAKLRQALPSDPTEISQDERTEAYIAFALGFGLDAAAKFLDEISLLLTD
jgi:hypothetical protein